MWYELISQKKKKISFSVNRGSLTPTSTTNLAPWGILLLSFSCRLLKPQAAGAVFRPVVFILDSLGLYSLSCLPGARSAALRTPVVGEVVLWLWEEAVWPPLWRAFTSSSTSERTGVPVKCTALSLRGCVLPYRGRGGGVELEGRKQAVLGSPTPSQVLPYQVLCCNGLMHNMPTERPVVMRTCYIRFLIIRAEGSLLVQRKSLFRFALF